jgi:AAA15 family ATPase/GTPase
MKINALRLQNFKRFTELRIEQIPEDSKLVLIIGSNGSGKSSIFDAYDFLQKGVFKRVPYNTEDESLNYYRKAKAQEAMVEVVLSNNSTIIKQDWHLVSGQELAKKFIGRSSIRIVSRMKNTANPNVLNNDTDSPLTYIENDERFTTDVFLYIQSINKALREPIFSGKQADTLKIFHDFIEPFNTSLKNIFGNNPHTTIQIAEFEDATPQSPAKLIFQKGDSKINYDFLSHGEKQVVILLLNFIVRREYYKDAIIFIDEMDVHLNTKLQYNTIKEITEKWIPDNSQLWTASHALGFIDYANDYDNGIILDFDDLDFDKQQTIIPAPKNNLQIFELAVSKDFLNKVFENKIIYFSEQTDAPIYNDLNFEDILFFDG